MTATLDAAPARPTPPAQPVPDWRTRILPASTGRGGWLATLAVGLLAGLLRVVRLDIPRGRIFDEIYYVCDAQNLLKYGVEVATAAGDPATQARCEPTGQPGFIVHPPLGKWAISLGMRFFGVEEFGWRIAAAVVGTLMVVVLVRVTRRMTGSTTLACLAGVLLSLDGLHFVQSRVAMLDVFVAAWVLAAFACLVADRDAVRRRLAVTDDEDLAGWGPKLGLRGWRLLAGVCLGGAVATKWSALYYVAVLVLLAFAWEVGARRTAGVRAPVRATVVRSAGPLLATLLVLPAALYVLSWAGWFASDGGYDRQWAESNPASGLGSVMPEALRSWWQYHREIFGFHDNLSTPHNYQSHPAGWLLLARPVSYYYPAGIGPGRYGCDTASCSREVLAIGTPAIWWAGIAVLVAMLWLWVSRRDWRAAAVLAMALTAIVPWVRDDLDGRTMFLFYALPAAPFLCLGLALVAGWALGGAGASPRRRRYAAFGIGAYVSVVVLNFAYLYPVLAAQTLPYQAWRSRMWFSSWI
ncbi:MAG: glycosyl transferase family 39 [Frankiales bacterium]|nr:glycosyl transferase family 39 [Frankiales bacterium]